MRVKKEKKKDLQEPAARDRRTHLFINVYVFGLTLRGKWMEKDTCEKDGLHQHEERIESERVSKEKMRAEKRKRKKIKELRTRGRLVSEEGEWVGRTQ